MFAVAVEELLCLLLVDWSPLDGLLELAGEPRSTDDKRVVDGVVRSCCWLVGGETKVLQCGMDNERISC